MSLFVGVLIVIVFFASVCLAYSIGYTNGRIDATILADNVLGAMKRLPQRLP